LGARLSVLDEILDDAQPSYLDSVKLILRRFGDNLGEAAFAGVEKEGFASHAARLIDQASIAPETKLLLIGDIFSLDWWCDLELGEEAGSSLAALARRIFFQEAQAISFEQTRADPSAMNAHVVFVGALRGLLHSPTRGAFDYVRALARDPANQKVEVFHADALTPELAAYARDRLGTVAGKVAFVSMDDDPDFLVKAMGEGARTFHFWCELPYAVHVSLAALVGPTIMFTCGDAAPIQFADVYWYCQEPGYIEGLWRRKGAPAQFADAYRRLDSAPFNSPVPLRPRSRADLGFRPEETVIVTAGHRLGVDMDQTFVDGMGALVLSDPNIRWVIVGRLQEFWISAFGAVLGDQFTHIPFDPDLASLFRVCDIFANPFRAGGGNTAIMAIDGGAVTMTRGDVGDVGAFVPAAHAARDADAYFEALRALVDDRPLRAAWLAEQQALLTLRLDQDNFARELKGLVRTAFKRFAARLPTPLETIFAQPTPKRLALKGSGRRARLR